jgi:hypothetical protein
VIFRGSVYLQVPTSGDTFNQCEGCFFFKGDTDCSGLRCAYSEYEVVYKELKGDK